MKNCSMEHFISFDQKTDFIDALSNLQKLHTQILTDPLFDAYECLPVVNGKLMEIYFETSIEPEIIFKTKKVIVALINLFPKKKENLIELGSIMQKYYKHTNDSLRFIDLLKQILKEIESKKKLCFLICEFFKHQKIIEFLLDQELLGEYLKLLNKILKSDKIADQHQQVYANFSKLKINGESTNFNYWKNLMSFCERMLEVKQKTIFFFLTLI